jgi:hypothetical protein
VTKSQEGITITCRSGPKGTSAVTVVFPDGTSHTDKIDLADAKVRARFVRAVCKGRKGIDKTAVAGELERLATEGVSRGRPNQADALVALATNAATLFHTPGGVDSEGYATVVVNGHAETWPVASKGFKRWLGKLYWDRAEKTPSSEALQAALNVIAGKAVHDGPECPVAVRVAEQGEAIYLDLADDKWQAVEVTARGWRVVADPPVKFIRRRGMLALPVPVVGGNIDELRPLLNLPGDNDWMLYVSWLVAALRPGRPFPVLVVNGEQGSAKSTLCRMARALIDPNQAPLRRPPREDRDLMIAATNGWVVAFDNLSGIAQVFSDALCALATGGGFSTRELYTDADEKLFDAMRPVMLNGIEDIATRPDLLDRAITLTLSEIPEDCRRDEDDLWQQFYRARPRILGALLDAVGAALKNRPGVRLTSKPRMADFACWVVAAEPALPWPAGAFLNAYAGNRGQANALALESSIVTAPLMSLLGRTNPYEGTALELLNELEKIADEKTRKRKDWPDKPRKLSGELRRLSPNLRRVGVTVKFGKHTRKGTPIKIERAADSAGKTPSPSSPPSPPPEPLDTPGVNGGVMGECRVTVGDGGDAAGDGRREDPHPLRHLETPEKHGENGRGDGADGRDCVLHTQSAEDEWGEL